MKIIFLDFDGVLNTVAYERNLYENELPEVDKKEDLFLLQIVSTTFVK